MLWENIKLCSYVQLIYDTEAHVCGILPFEILIRLITSWYTIIVTTIIVLYIILYSICFRSHCHHNYLLHCIFLSMSSSKQHPCGFLFLYCYICVLTLHTIWAVLKLKEQCVLSSKAFGVYSDIGVSLWAQLNSVISRSYIRHGIPKVTNAGMSQSMVSQNGTYLTAIVKTQDILQGSCSHVILVAVVIWLVEGILYQTRLLRDFHDRVAWCLWSVDIFMWISGFHTLVSIKKDATICPFMN